MICIRCNVSKEFDKLIPRSCFDKEGNWFKSHKWRNEKICSCGHGETSHYYRWGILQCSVGECFPFRSSGHELLKQETA